MFTTLVGGKNKDCASKPHSEMAFSLFYIFVAYKLW